MSSPNKEQKEAIYAPVNNVIVSAGAGSGKTFVLKSRVKDKILNKVNVNELVILTFTNAAAAEMKDRIRKVITEEAQNDDSFKAQFDLVESAYITTFDSYAQSLVKKYNYLLGIDKHFTIIEDNIVKNELRKITTEILLEYYKNPTDEFKDLIDDICYKDDEEFINTILKMYESLVNIYGRFFAIYFIIGTVLLIFLEIVYFMMAGIFGIVIGYCSNNLKTLKSIIIGIGSYGILSIISFIILGFMSRFVDIEIVNNEFPPTHTIKLLGLTFIIVYLLYNLIYYFAAKKILSKGVNVE